MSRRFRLPGKLPSVKFPVHYEGAPPRRLYIPEWYITMVKPKEEMPKNYVRFHIPADMTKYDMKEYLDKIYNVKVLNIKLSIVNYVRYKEPLPWKIGEQYEWKFIDPWKIAHIFLANEQKFEFPNPLVNKDEEENEKTSVQQYDEYLKKEQDAPRNEQAQDKSKMFFENRWL